MDEVRVHVPLDKNKKTSFPNGVISTLSFLAMSMLRIVAKDSALIYLHIANTAP